MKHQLRTTDHDRDSAGLRYVYPVVSRRARGVSVGVNLNPNNACNWRCIYCQVPGLVNGKGPVIDLDLLERELCSTLDLVRDDAWLKACVPPEARRLNDVAFSGNGEPTTSPSFEGAIEVVARVLGDRGLAARVKTVLITNGSQIGREAVDRGILRLASLAGEVWFKLDSSTSEGMKHVNDTATAPDRHLERLRRAAELCPTWVQTCVFAQDGAPPSATEREAYVEAVASVKDSVRGVLLYGIERPSHQPEAPRLTKVPEAWLMELARDLESRGIAVRVSP